MAAAYAISFFTAGSQSAEPAVKVVGTTLRATLADGSIRQGTQLTGATLIVRLGGRTMKVKIAGVENDPRDPSGEVLLYDFRAIAPDGSEAPLCEPDPDGRRLGLALAGHTDAAGIVSKPEQQEFELFCTASPQGKCLRLGYAPWRQADGRSMRDWFNACVRMMRGDYCGDGRHFTRNGTWIDVYDRIGVQKSDQDPSLTFEAVWNAAGAVCVAHTRVPELVTLDGLGRLCPRLANRLGPENCNEDAPGGLIVNRSR